MRTPLVAIAVLAAGCGGGMRATTRSIPRHAPRVEMDPIRVEAQRDASGALRLTAYDAQSLFAAAGHDLAAGNCRRAVELYDRIAEQFPESRFVSASLYNAGLCLEDLHRDPQAVQRYTSLQSRLPDSPDIKDSLYRMGGCLERLGRWREAIATFDRALAREDLTGDERLEAMARRGAATFELGELVAAEQQMRDALLYYRHGSGAEPIQTDFFAAEAQYYLGEVLRIRFEAVRFTPMEAEMRRELEEKCQLLLDAQAAYILAIRVTNPHWAAAAGYRIGNLFSTLYDHIVAAPVPPELDAEQREIYFDELRRQVRPLVDKAVRVWERTMAMGARTGLGDNEWVERTRQGLERLRAFLNPPHPAGAPMTPPLPGQQNSGPGAGGRPSAGTISS
ncbi:MAG: tetratricopeptide repeat protein [Deltaproteobacteria bacterium]|nr:tetratricopeptide repeat protein [Deltaproteobacteria bacterium]